ncbi:MULTISPECIES: hypothetical protein [Pseudomonas]|jgi:hypothetical protein|uniref:Uncharacterized protein n=1 Tax=Pseudomonas citronellolis TaxID=53408 RepID=A0AAW6P456_9PSED|nr:MULTISPECIES: hypothetical protein [Pseudomonas]KSW25676.1 hypothetical protein AOX63_18545 [Pseudomonas sp. ADP]KES24107.1 hypothetical protein FG99_10045 [Pseudomonas sp. AAC]KRV72951.1 hypothetical protein AO742_17820 [Pseudomonas citronellolis]KRW77782.1 hypothetical protein AO738_29020 [Pseudomonas citronellolis]MBB1608788.1 hypothetical protein [Pseudomonas sp. UMC76]
MNGTRRKHLRHYRHYLLAALLGLFLLGLHESVNQDLQPSCLGDDGQLICSYPSRTDLQVLLYFR